MDSLIGTTIGRYHISRHLARGGMADVYLAEDGRLRRYVALKVVLPHLLERQDVIKRFQREAKIVAKLQHPNIVSIYDVGLTPSGQPYMAMQYVEGGSLRDRLRHFHEQRYHPPTEDVLSLIRQVADALRVAHEAGIIHRDIKPNNILLRNDGTPVLADLGIAAVGVEFDTAQLTRTGHMLGTPHYVSPEQALGDPLDPRSDIYSLGVVLYELLAGRSLFSGEGTMTILRKHINEEPAPLYALRPDLSPATNRLVAICLQKSPAARFSNASKLVEALDGAISAEKRGDSSTRVTRALLGWEHWWRLLSVPQRTALVIVPLALILLAAFGLMQINRGETTAVSSPEPAVAQTALIVTATSDSSPESEPPRVSEEIVLEMPTPVPQPTSTAAPTAAPPTPTPFLVEQGLIGRSVRGQPINTTRIGSGENVVLFIGGFHAGFAPGTVRLAEQAVDYFSARPEELPPSVTLYIIPNANPDSPPDAGQISGRLNANSVDLNRNWDCEWQENATVGGRSYAGIGGPAPFSEPESQILRDFIMNEQPVAVIFWEARAAEGLVSPGACDGVSRQSWPLAATYGLAAGYVTADFEAVTNATLNGDAANWLDTQGIPTVSVLLPDYDEVDWENNRLGLLAVLNEFADEP